MAEENKNDITITTEDVDALRILLHNVKGLSAVSAPSSALSSEQED